MTPYGPCRQAGSRRSSPGPTFSPIGVVRRIGFWHEFINGNPPDFLAVDHDLNRVPRLDELARSVTVRARIGVNLDLLLERVDDPVERNGM